MNDELRTALDELHAGVRNEVVVDYEDTGARASWTRNEDGRLVSREVAPDYVGWTWEYRPIRRVQVNWRHKGGRKPENVVCVARPSKWGNPFTVAEHGRDEAIRLYRQYLQERPQVVTAARRDLAGKDLACYCRLDQACHADVLLEVANA